MSEKTGDGKNKKRSERDDGFLFAWTKCVWDERSGLTRNGIHILTALSTFMDPNGHNGYPSQKALAERARSSIESVRNGLNEGKEKCFIKAVGTIRSNGGGKPVIKYSAIIPEWAKGKKKNKKSVENKLPKSEQEEKQNVNEKEKCSTTKNEKFEKKFDINNFKTYSEFMLKSKLKISEDSLEKFLKKLEKERETASKDDLMFYKSRIDSCKNEIKKIKQEIMERNWQPTHEDED